MAEAASAAGAPKVSRLDRLAHALLERETLDEDEAYAAAGVRRETAPAAMAHSAAS